VPDLVVTPVIPALGRYRQEDHEFEVSLSYIVKTLSKKKGWKCSSVVESLPSIFKALDLIPSTSKRKQKTH
jgi:hypothetical protein